MLVISTYKAHICSKREPFHALPPLLRLVVPLSCAREALPHAFNFGVFKYDKSNPTTIRYIYNESEKLNKSCDVAFDSNNWWNLTLIVESLVTRAGLRYTRDYLTPGICSLIKPAAMEKLMSFRTKIHTVML